MSSTVSNSTVAANASSKSDTKPWYRYPLVWMVISGPLIVVVASLISAYVAIHGQDPVLLREEIPANQKDMRTGANALTPALQARNHAATTSVKAADQ
jgi:uncharacterized protein